MGQRNFGQVITDGSMTGTSVISSKRTNIGAYPAFSYWMQWTGTPTGADPSFVVHVSNLKDPDVSVDADWTTYTLVTEATNPAGAAGQTGIDISNSGFQWAHLRYTNASGTGTLQAHFGGKGL